MQSDNTPSNKFTDNQWNQLKHDFISNMLQNTEPNNYRSENTPINIHPTTLHHSMDEKPFIMSIQDQNLLSGEEYSYNMTNTNTRKNNVYSGIDLINYTLSSNHDIYDEVHRDMYKKWSNKVDILNQLNQEGNIFWIYHHQLLMIFIKLIMIHIISLVETIYIVMTIQTKPSWIILDHEISYLMIFQSPKITDCTQRIYSQIYLWIYILMNKIYIWTKIIIMWKTLM
ncbi:erythrocyte membrane protein 1 (PfEMP1), exon 2, putative [Plasmodium sp. DRC-Itaito]|nr:erythrocyte membrane protein 1 (PfEMP1), exon 2, putative [Plasmodium sp. DRC-Itaito]